MDYLNYHHLRYFWMVVREGGLRKAAERFHVSQPTISAQICALEQALGEKLFRRSPRGLLLTDTGQRAFSYADEIFALGQEFLHSIKQRPSTRPLRVNIGIADALPKVISHELIKPIFSMDQPVQAACMEGKVGDLLAQLVMFRLDLVLADEPAPSSLPMKVFNHHLGQCGIVFCAMPGMAANLRTGFPKSLTGAPALLPVANTVLRRTLDDWFRNMSLHPRVLAEYEDVALMKVAAADGLGFFPLPLLAVDEAIKRFGFEIIGNASGCREQFYAISAERRLSHPAVLAVKKSARDALTRKK